MVNISQCNKKQLLTYCDDRLLIIVSAVLSQSLEGKSWLFQMAELSVALLCSYIIMMQLLVVLSLSLLLYNGLKTHVQQGNGVLLLICCCELCMAEKCSAPCISQDILWVLSLTNLLVICLHHCQLWKRLSGKRTVSPRVVEAAVVPMLNSLSYTENWQLLY